MPYRNRVTPYGDIIVAPGERGLFMGNRGCLHVGHEIVRPWNGKRWITCALEFKGWQAPKWEPGRWTALFLYDEAVALAAGHRPCALCRRADYERYRDAWARATGSRPGADAMDAQLHEDRLDRRAKRLQWMSWSEVPDGAFVDLDGLPALVLADMLYPWAPSVGYGAARALTRRGTATVITPMATVVVLRGGYELATRVIPSAAAT